MARVQPWTDSWATGLKHPARGEVVYRDPTLNKHRLVVKAQRKVFEIQMERPKAYGPRRTFVVQTGSVPGATIAEARTHALEAMTLIRDGKDPHGKAPAPGAPGTTLAMAFADYEARPGLKPGTLRNARHDYNRHLAHWATTPLKTLVENPREALDLHRKITQENGPSAADHALRFLRTIYRHAAKLDTSLPTDRHPCTAVEWHGDKTRQGASIPAALMPAWHTQLEALRAASPMRACFHMLCLRLGTRPGELAKATWADVDMERRILTLPETKTHLVEVPLPAQALPELAILEECRVLNRKADDYIFPASSKVGRISQLTEPKSTLSHTGNCGRHSHHSIGTILGIDELTLDVLEGRSLIKAGAGAGRGYVDRLALGPKLRAAQQSINDEIDRLFGTRRRKARARMP